jgi:hypothetical protein
MCQVDAPWEQRLRSAEGALGRWLNELEVRRALRCLPMVRTVSLTAAGTLEQLTLLLAQHGFTLRGTHLVTPTLLEVEIW